jgi:hypothetical protein
MHHLVVLAAPLELLTQLRVGFAEGYEGIELPHLLKELLELGFGHGLREGLDHAPADEEHPGKSHLFLGLNLPAQLGQ